MTVRELIADLKKECGRNLDREVEISSSPYSKHTVLSVYLAKEDGRVYIDITDADGEEFARPEEDFNPSS